MQLTKARAALLFLVIGAVFFAAGYGWRRLNARPVPEPEKTAAVDTGTTAVRYQANAPQLQFLRTEQTVLMPEPLLDPLNGRVAYDDNYTARVNTPIAGRVVQIDVQPGDKVKAGAVLARLDSPEYAAAVADVSRSESEVSLKTRAYSRAQELVAAEVIARKDVEVAESELKTAQAENRRAQQRLRNLVPGAARIGEGGGFALRSPIDGVVADRQLNPGAEVRPDATTPLFVITDPRHVWVIIDLPERYLTKIRVGQMVGIEVDTFKGADIRGRIASIGQVLDAASRRVQVRCVVDNPQQLLKPEMYARVTPLAEERHKLARVPNSALVTRGLYNYVFVQTSPGVFERRQVTLGLRGSEVTYVQTGLGEGDAVVTSGALLLDAELSARQ